MRDTFIKTLLEIARENKNIELITGDLGFGVLKPYWSELPDQLTNAGIAEQNMTAAAAGMALTGKKVFTYSIGNFPTLRCLEQIRNDCAYHNADVKIICVGGGFVYGGLGMSHHATEDIAALRALPNVSVFAPADKVEAKEICLAMKDYPGTCYIRLGRGGEKVIRDKIDNFKVGKALKVQDGSKVAIFFTGAIYEEVEKALGLLKEKDINPIVYSFPTIKPIDKEMINKYAKEVDAIFTIEEHNIIGGFGSAVAEVMAELKGNRAQLIRIGINDVYASKVGSQSYLRDQYGMSGNKIYERVLEVLKDE